jgi:hypothetical protein
MCEDRGERGWSGAVPDTLILSKAENPAQPMGRQILWYQNFQIPMRWSSKSPVIMILGLDYIRL